MFRKIITYLTIYSFMFSNVCWAAMITPDGRTQTTVNVNGHVYDVTTSTVSGKNAFNSFSNFDVYKGTTVNLYLPGSTLNLINLVRDGKTNIDGILNSIKNGKIGGNVFILNPHGIAIGKSGVVNVGSLMLSTPNKEFMDQVIGQDGSISELATKSVLAGDLPINPAGVISVKGKIKALDSVAVRAGGVVNAGEILANLKPTQASDIVNTGGLDIDAPLAFKDGKIGVFAENDVVNAGTIKADAGGSGKAGGIVVKAGGNISLRKGSLISAKGSAEHKDGGSVVVFADNKADLEKGAEIAADAYDGSAKGGFVELSALKEVNLNGGTMTAGGRDGMIFIDPEILNITSDSAYKGQDNIYAIANTINVKQGVSLVKENGDITLIARDTDAGWVKKSGAFLNIEDNATLKGDNIYLYALAGDAEVLDGIVTGEVTEDNGSSALTAIGETLKAKGLEFFEALTDSGLFVGYSKSEAEAGINIGKNVTIAAKEDVKINSKVVSNSEVDTLGTGIDVTVAENSAASGVFIDSGVNISGKNVAITSEIDSTTSAEATTSAYGSGRGVPVDIAVAVGLTDTDNKIDIKNGASITATDKLEIAADTRKSHNVAAEGLAYQDGWAAAGVAYSESESSSSVTVGGTIKGGTVNITSDIEAVKNASSAKTVVGNGIFDRLNVWAGNKMLDGLSKWITAIPAQTHSQSNVKLAMSGAVSYSKHNNSSNVKIANNYGEGQTAADTPKTTVTGDKVTIGSHVMDVITNGASASVSPKTNDKDHSQDQNKENSFAGAVGYGVYDNTSRAEIGAGVAVNASQSLELTSETEEPVLWPDASILNVFDGLAGNVLEKGEALLTNIEKYLEDNPMSFYTSLVKSSANTSSGDANPGEEKNGIVGIAGSVNLMEFNNKSDAVIADGAEINQLYNPNNAGYTRLDKAPAVKVSADSYVETFNMSGEYGGAAKFGLGGSYLQTWYDSKVNAIIGDNVKLYAGDLDVNASATHRNLSIAGTAGYKKSDTFGFQGTFDWLKSNSDVLAQISNQADVLVEKADEKSGVTVNAESENSFVNIAGGVVRGSMVGIGASGALNDISQNTRAVIGSLNQNDNSAVTGKIVTDGNILVNAQNSSNLYAVSAAGALITQDKGQDNGSTNFGLGLSGTASYNTLESVSEAYVNNAVIKGVSGASGDEEKRPALEVASNNDNDVLTVGGGVSFVKQSGTNVGIAGAVGINKLDGSRSVAFVNNAKVDNIGDLKIHAASTGEIIAAAESASGAFGKTGITIAGAVSINEIGNRTAAYVSNSKVNGGKFVSADNVEIKAESGADIFALAGNISAAGTGGVGASVAVNEIDNTTESYAKNADIEAEKGNISITAQNTSEIETSSAGVGYGGKASVSGSVSVNNINNRTYGYADNSGLTAYGSVLLKSIAKSVINFYGGMIALSTKGVGGGGTVGTSSVSEDTLAEIRNNSEVNAYGNKPAEDGTTGVGVAAENDSIVNMYGVNAGLGKAAGIGANVAVSQVNNSAVARIDNAKINQDLSGGNDEKYAVNQEVNVFAANKTQLETHAGTLAGGTVGVGLSSVTTLVENTTKAEIVNGSNVKSKGDIGVNTDAKTYFNSVVVGGAGGKVGVAGNVNVAEIGNHNRALVDASTIAGYGSMTVAAKDVTRLGKRLKDDGTEEDFAVALGAGGVGLYNGTGASVLVSDIANDTTAKIGNSSVDVAKKLSLTADSDSSILSYVFAAGLGAYSGVAGSVAVNTIDNTTEAFITEDEGKTTEINQNMSNASQDVKIAASADAAIENLLGSAAVGLGSGGASVDVSTIDGRTSAGTIGSLALSAGRNIDITADSVRDISVEGIAGSGGAGTLSGAISVIRVGSNYTADMQEQTAGVLETVNAEIARNNEYQDSLNINGLPTDIDLSEFDRDVNKEFSTSVSKDVGTSAYVGLGATVKAGGNIAVAATDDVHTRNLTGEMAAGGVSAGASVGITDIRNAAKAYIAGNALVASGKDFSLSALTKTDVDSKSMGGVIATMFAAGGSVVHVNADSHAQAYVGNGAVVNAGNVTMEAEDKSDIEALAAGVEASVGGAAGASVAIVNKTNDVRAFVADGAKVTADSFEGSAKDDVSVDVQAIAGAAGVVSGEGAYAESSIVSKLKSYVGDAVFKLAEGFRMFTSGSSHGNAGALGVNAGVLSVGASVAKSDIDLDNQAVVDGSAEIAAADVYVGAGQLKADAVTDSLAAAGALIGGNGAQSSAGVGGKVLAKVEDGAKFTGAGNVEILSMSNSGQAAVSSAYRGGILAAGATLADAAGHLDTITEIGAIDLTADKLTAKAEATDILYAETVSGSGGVISGAAVTGDIGSLKVHIAEKTMESPTVTITSDIAANDGRAPNIDIDGTVTNYGGLVKVNNAAGSIYVNGTIHGKDLNITAGRDIYQGYTNGFRHIGGSPEAAWDAIASGNESGHLTDGSATASSNADIDDSRSSLVAGNNIFLSGRYINLNGLVQSGTTDYNLDIPDGEIQLAGGLTSETALADYNRNKQYNYNASPLYKLSDKYGNVDAYYNAVTGQIELADVRVEGGYVEIYGHILNTSQNSGEIMVTDGYGRVNINNRSGKEIVVNNMSLSNRISGVIKITDLAKKNAAGEYLQTTYTRNGNTITVADNNGGSKDINAVQDENGKSSTAYSPLENQRYVWQTGQKTVSETTKTYEGDSFWGMDWLVPDTGEGVTVTGPTPVGDPVKMEDGERIEISSSDNKYEYEKDSYVSSEDKLIYHNVEEWSEGWWIFSVDKYKTTDIYQKGETHINTHSVKADYDIKISFKGYDSALADIVSKSDITLNGVINNRSGTTNITTEGAIKVGSDYARILGDGLNLTANNGIGSNGTALAVDVAGGNLNVVNKVSGDVNLKSAGSDFVFNSIVNNGGNTSVNAAGSIFGASADSLISGGKISLTAQTGSIGTDDTALKIQTSGDEDSALTVLANNNVNLVQEEGDLGLESVVSLAGDVNVKVENGSVFDANTNEVYDDKTVEQLTKIWDDMGLDVGNEQMKEAFLNGKKAEYNAYWQYKSRQPEGGEPEFRFTAAEREALLNKELNESEKQALGMDKITDEYINRLEAEKTAEYKKLAAVYGDEGKYGSSYDAGWTYRLSEAEEAELAEGAGWNKSQLAYSIFKAKEGEVVDTQYMIEDPNVVGKNVTIEANGSIGQDTGSETFKLSELSPETDVDKILLIASAERDNLEIAEDGDTVTVHKREDVDIHADSITLKARDYIYLGGEEDINVNTVEAGEGQKITIAGAKGIYNVATEADHANVIGGDLVLEAADGSIGTEDKALNLKLADGAKVTARSQNDIFLNSTGGDLVAESLLAKDGVLSLTADGSLIAGTLKEGEIVNLQGQSIVVNAENVGDEDNYLTVALGDKENEEHTLTLNVAGDANVNNLGAQELAVESSAVGGTLRLKSASSLIGATADSLLSAAALEFNGVGGDIGAAGRYLNVSTERLTASADGSIYLNNVRSAVFEGVNAGREIEITSAADLTLNDATAGGSVKVNGAGSLFANNLRAGGDLLMTAENDLDVSGATAEGSVTLVSRLGDMVADLIGSGGDMKIDAAGNLTAGNINAGEKVSIAADSADLDEVVSGGDMRIAVNGDNIFGRLTSEKGNIALTVENADANLRGSVKAANGRVTVTAGGSVLNAGAPAEGAIIANTVDLTAKNGSIGTSGNYLTVDSSYTEPGWISALAEKGIFISEVNGDMNVRRFASNGDIDMRVESSIMAAPGMDPEVPNFKADNITLHTNGSIGMPDNRLVLALNDNGRGKINLKAETGIAVNKLGDGLVSDYVYNLQSGKVMIGLPSGHANIARVTAVGGFELYVREHTDFYNIWLGISDLEARMMNPPYTEYPSENPIEIMRAPLLDRYKLQTGDGLFMNIGSLTGEEEKLSVGF